MNKSGAALLPAPALISIAIPCADRPLRFLLRAMAWAEQLGLVGLLPALCVWLPLLLLLLAGGCAKADKKKSKLTPKDRNAATSECRVQCSASWTMVGFMEMRHRGAPYRVACVNYDLFILKHFSLLLVRLFVNVLI